ncbi:pirin family protein [Pontibacter sp. E15-1]|uniref:pirin family protein n=1 Tax=Pontibacter sp. E15-1 TaxID=2919918 RepID=UPI001F4F9E7B|nr:pirin-like bicupin family protein [Pontibacter sp. E15-1]MCJ8166643.1 pirin family protein [Pontibacter sp. E15-1]
MMKLITAAERHYAEVGDWLKSYYLFSFADYYSPNNIAFGPLRVLNQDTIKPNAGFPSHPHAEMEIIQIVTAGQLTHKDNLGNEMTLKAGSVQRITSGMGITVSETNEGEVPLELFQLWFLPNKRGLAPSYEHMSLDFLDEKDKLVPLVTGQKVLENVAYLNSNSSVYYGHLSQGEEIDFKTFKLRQTLVYVVSGSMLVNNMEVDTGDQVRIADQTAIRLHGSAEGRFLLVDVPAIEANY